ncbi:hypothetical protein D3C80_1642650 [compost metagenome]
MGSIKRNVMADRLYNTALDHVLSRNAFDAGEDQRVVCNDQVTVPAQCLFNDFFCDVQR